MLLMNYRMNRIWRTPFARHHHKHPVTLLTSNQDTLRSIRQSENLEQTIQWRDVVVAKVNHSVHNKMAEAQQELGPASILSMERYKIWEVFLAMKVRLHNVKYKTKLEQRLLHVLRELTEDKTTLLLGWTMLHCLKQPSTGLIGKETFLNVVEPLQTYHSPMSLQERHSLSPTYMLQDVETGSAVKLPQEMIYLHGSVRLEAKTTDR